MNHRTTGGWTLNFVFQSMPEKSLQLAISLEHLRPQGSLISESVCMEGPLLMGVWDVCSNWKKA